MCTYLLTQLPSRAERTALRINLAHVDMILDQHENQPYLVDYIARCTYIHLRISFQKLTSGFFYWFYQAVLPVCTSSREVLPKLVQFCSVPRIVTGSTTVLKITSIVPF